mgnify:CR=1 FL=1
MVNRNYLILNVLRGLSALYIVFFHFFIFFFQHQSMAADLLQIEPFDFAAPFYLEAIDNFPINTGHFAVSFFFLISGFLIPASLQRYPSLKDFLIHKVFRLWPSYVICFSTGLLCVFVLHLLQGRGFPYDFGNVLSYFFWVRDIFHYPFIDGSVWTLEIQIKFYIFASLVWSVWKKDFLEKICLLTILMSLLIYGAHILLEGEELSWFYVITLLRKNLKFFTLILLGTCLFSAYSKQISWQKALFLLATLLLAFLSPLFISPDSAKTVGYVLGFFLFSGFIFFHVDKEEYKGLFGKVTNWLSEISYPLYVGHVLPGYVIMYYMIDRGFSPYLGIFIATAYSLIMADFVHKKIEASFLKRGSQLFSYFWGKTSQ